MRASMAKPQTANANVSRSDQWDRTHHDRRTPLTAADPRFGERKERGRVKLGGEGIYRRCYPTGLALRHFDEVVLVVEGGDWSAMRESKIDMYGSFLIIMEPAIDQKTR